MTLLTTGKTKSVFVDDENARQVIMEFRDDITAGNRRKSDVIPGRGEVNCHISQLLFDELHKNLIKTHYIEQINMTSLRCHRLAMVPLEFVVRNIAAGSLCRETYIEEGTLLNKYTPLVEIYLKDDELGDPLVTESRLMRMGYNIRDIDHLICAAHRVNSVLKPLFDAIGYDLVDFKVELGYDADMRILVADELSPDNCRIRKKGTNESFDKDIYRQHESDTDQQKQRVLEAYQTIATHLMAHCSHAT